MLLHVPWNVRTFLFKIVFILIRLVAMSQNSVICVESINFIAGLLASNACVVCEHVVSTVSFWINIMKPVRGEERQFLFISHSKPFKLKSFEKIGLIVPFERQRSKGSSLFRVYTLIKAGFYDSVPTSWKRCNWRLGSSHCSRNNGHILDSSLDSPHLSETQAMTALWPVWKHDDS